MCQYGSYWHWHDLIHQMDAVSAHLNGTLDEVIYMRQPEQFDDGTGKVCKLIKSIYGRSMGLERGNVDKCIYYKVSKEEMLYIAIYVDDVLIFCNNIATVNKIKQKLRNSK